MSGKGSKQRPTQISKESFSVNWDAVFGKKEKKSECGGECQVCIKNPEASQVLQITEPIENLMVQ